MRRLILIAMTMVVIATASVIPAAAQGGTAWWTPGIFDRGPRPHAMGTVWGNLYYVVRGDTLFSIGLRFGLPWPVIAHANGIAFPPSTQAGSCLVIPGLGSPPPVPWPPPPPRPTPLPPPPPTPPTPVSPAIRIDIPAPGAILPPTFTVSGWGRGLYEGNVVVRVFDANRVLLAERATVLQGPNVATGGEGVWSVQITVSTSPGMPGLIEAFSPQPTPAGATVRVVFGSGAGGPGVVYPPGQCQVQAIAGMPIYTAPNGEVLGFFAADGWFEALERRPAAGMNWYKLQPGGSAGGPPAWAPTSSLSAVSTGCQAR